MTRSVLVGAATLALIFAAQSPVWAAKDGSVQIKGSDTMVNLVQAWAETYMEKNPEAFIAVTGGGSGTGLAALINGTCDLAMSSREIKSKEIEMAAKRGVTPQLHKLALDGLAVVVHGSNPVSTLTTDQLAGIFTGKIRNWNELGGPDLGIVVLSREVNSGTHVYFKEHILRHNDAKSQEEFSANALLMPSSQAIADEVRSNTAAIGYFGMGYLHGTLKAVSIAPKDGEPGVMPTLENIVSGAYPISRPLYFYTNADGDEAAKKFLDFCMSADGQALVAQNDFVPISVEAKQVA